MLQTAVRLPGPPRWAGATRAVAIRTAEEAVRADGWVCLVPGVDGAAAVYGTAVRILQLAPLADGSALGVLHPLVAVRVGGIRSGVASVDVIPPGQTRDADELQAVLGLVVDGLRRLKLSVQCTERELRMSEDPAAMLGWQLVLPAETCQAYLAARDPTARLRALADYLAVAG